MFSDQHYGSTYEGISVVVQGDEATSVEILDTSGTTNTILGASGLEQLSKILPKYHKKSRTFLEILGQLAFTNYTLLQTNKNHQCWDGY